MAITSEFLRWLPYHLGKYEVNSGIDLFEKFEEVGLTRAITVMMYIVSQDQVDNSREGDQIYAIRAKINGLMGDETESANNSGGPKKNDGLHENYIIPTENGYEGLLPPIGG